MHVSQVVEIENVTPAIVKINEVVKEVVDKIIMVPVV